MIGVSARHQAKAVLEFLETALDYLAYGVGVANTVQRNLVPFVPQCSHKPKVFGILQRSPA